MSTFPKLAMRKQCTGYCLLSPDPQCVILNAKQARSRAIGPARLLCCMLPALRLTWQLTSKLACSGAAVLSRDRGEPAHHGRRPAACQALQRTGLASGRPLHASGGGASTWLQARLRTALSPAPSAPAPTAGAAARRECLCWAGCAGCWRDLSWAVWNIISQQCVHSFQSQAASLLKSKSLNATARAREGRQSVVSPWLSQSF